MRIHKYPVWLLITLTVAACASSGRVDGGVRRNPDVISLAELNEISDRSAYEAVERLRPRWLRGRGGRTGLPGIIWDDRSYRFDILRSMPIEQVEEMKFINAMDATTLWGTGYPDGIIQVTSRIRR